MLEQSLSELCFAHLSSCWTSFHENHYSPLTITLVLEELQFSRAGPVVTMRNKKWLEDVETGSKVFSKISHF